MLACTAALNDSQKCTRHSTNRWAVPISTNHKKVYENTKEELEYKWPLIPHLLVAEEW